MTQTIAGARRMIVKKAIREYAEDEGPIEPGSAAYHDLMQNVENQVQVVLEEMGEYEY